MIPKVGDKVRFNPEFLEYHCQQHHGLEHWVGSGFIFSVIDLRYDFEDAGLIGIRLNIKILDPSKRGIAHDDTIYVNHRNGIFGDTPLIPFILAEAAETSKTTTSRTQYCTCTNPVIVQTGFTTVYNVCKVCGKEHL